MAVVAKLVNAPGCGSGIRGFKSRRSPHSFQTNTRALVFFYIKTTNYSLMVQLFYVCFNKLNNIITIKRIFNDIMVNII